MPKNQQQPPLTPKCERSNISTVEKKKLSQALQHSKKKLGRVGKDRPTGII